MKLFRLKINGVAFDGNTAYTEQELNGNAAYVAADNNPSVSDYDDITSIENWEQHGKKVVNDYKAIRDQIKEEVIAIGFENLTQNEKLIAATHKIGTHAQRLAALGGDINLLVALGAQYHGRVFECRQIRMAWAVSCVHNHLEHIIEGGYTAPEIILSSIPQGFIDAWVSNGLGGVCDGDNAEGLFDYINNTVGTSFENTGLRSKTWTPEGLVDMNAFCDKLMAILQNGIY